MKIVHNMSPSHKSRSWKRRAVVTPGGTNKLRFTREKKDFAHCPSCGQMLHGVAIEGSASEKRTNRPFGGQLCSSCMRAVLRQESENTGVIEPGREAIKIAGHDAGEHVKIIKVEGKFAVVESRKKQRRVNVKHLEPL